MVTSSVIHIDPEILGGTPVFVGTRVPLKNLIDYLQGGHPLDGFLDDFPSVTREQAIAALAEAGEALSQRVLLQLAGIIEDVHQQLRLTDREVADVVEAQEGTLQRWRRGEGSPTGISLGRLIALSGFLGELHRTFRDVADGVEWLGQPNPALQNRTPREVVLAGQIERVTGILYAINAGIPL